MIHVNKNTYFACDECPIVEEFERRMEIAKQYPEFGAFQFDHCACDKVEDEFFMCGYCEDAWITLPSNKKKGVRKTGRAYRRKMNAKIKQQRIKAPYAVRSYWIDDNQKMHYPKESKNRVFWKRYTNRVFRHCKDDYFPKGNGYRKSIDSWYVMD